MSFHLIRIFEKDKNTLVSTKSAHKACQFAAFNQGHQAPL